MLNTRELQTKRAELVQRLIDCTTVPHEPTLKTNFEILQKHLAQAEIEIRMQARSRANQNPSNQNA